MRRLGFTIIELLIFLASLFIGLFVYLWLTNKVVQEERNILTTVLIQPTKIKKPELITTVEAPGPAIQTTVSSSYKAVNWIPFSSSFFTLSFRLPTGLEIKEDAKQLSIAMAPYTMRESGDDNAFFRLTKYSNNKNQESQLKMYKQRLQNIEESVVEIDGLSFVVLNGDDLGNFKGAGVGRVTVVFFNASWLEIVEHPVNNESTLDLNELGNKILLTFQFVK